MTPVDFYTKILRKIKYATEEIRVPSYNPEMLQARIRNTKALVIEFCSEPRTAKEICENIKAAYSHKNKERYIYSLVESGQVKATNLINPNTYRQQYVRAEVAAIILSENALLEYCKTPRRRKEMLNHFNTDWEQIKSCVNRLVEEGRLICDIEICEMNNHYNRYTTKIK